MKLPYTGNVPIKVSADNRDSIVENLAVDKILKVLGIGAPTAGYWLCGGIPF